MVADFLFFFLQKKCKGQKLKIAFLSLSLCVVKKIGGGGGFLSYNKRTRAHVVRVVYVKAEGMARGTEKEKEKNGGRAF